MSGSRFGGGLAFVFTLALASCAGGGASSVPPHSYDLGIETPATSMPAVELRGVRAVRPFDSNAMYYRLAYRDGAELVAFAQSRWAAPPGELVRKQLARATRAGTPRCTLEIELQEFSQVFSAPDTSTAQLELVATLGAPSGSVETRAMRLSEAGAGSTAAQGVKAMQRAVTRAIAELVQWIDGVAGCRG